MAQLIKKRQKGQLIVELLVAFGLSSIFIPAIILGFISGAKGKAQQEARVEALGLMREAEEAARSVRERSWVNVSTNGTYYPRIIGSEWFLSTDPAYGTVGSFERSITISDMDPIDPSEKVLRIDVSWTNVFPTTISTTLYLTRYLENDLFIETTQAQFDLGTKTGVATTLVDDGEVVLSGGGRGDWCQPDLTLATVDLPKNGVANAVSVIPATETDPGYAFAGTGENASGVSFARVDITDTDPPTASIPNPGTFDGYKTNGVFGEKDYAYLATDTNAKQGVIIDLNNSNPVTGKFLEAGTLDLQIPSANGQSVVVQGNVAYLASNNGKLYSFDITSRAGVHTPASNVTLAGTAYKIKVIGSNIYAAINSTTTQLQIIPITGGGTTFGTPVDISVAGQFGRDVYVNMFGTRAYLATSTSVSQSELFIINTDPISPSYKQTLSTYDTSSMNPNGVVVVTNNKAIVVGTGGIEYQVVDIANDTITSCGSGLNIDAGINGVATAIQPSGAAFSYIITGDATSEFKIIEGGPSGTSSTTGTFESNTFDAGDEVAFNRYAATTVTQQGVTSISIQFAGADAVGGSCSGVAFTFVSPNPDGSIPLDNDGNGYENPARCFRYRVSLSSTDPNSTPIFEDITVNYSP